MKPRSIRSITTRLAPALITCAPIISTREACRFIAATMRSASTGRSGCAYGTGASFRSSKEPRSRSCSRSASARMRRRVRTKRSYLLFIRFNPSTKRKEQVPAQKVRDNQIRADGAQTLSFPLVDQQTLRLTRGYPNGLATGLLHLLNFDESISENDQMLGTESRR